MFIPDLHTPRPVAHFFPQKEVVEGGSTDVIKYLLENLVDDLLIHAMNRHHFEILRKEFENKL